MEDCLGILEKVLFSFDIGTRMTAVFVVQYRGAERRPDGQGSGLQVEHVYKYEFTLWR